MKTTFYKYMIGALALVSAALTGCSNEESLIGADDINSQELISVPVSIGVSVGDDNATRTILAEENDVMTWKWEKGDQILVYQRIGNESDIDDNYAGCLGYLTAEEPTDGGKRAVFSGVLNFTESMVAQKKAVVRLWYLGKGIDVTLDDSDFKKAEKNYIYEVPVLNQVGTESSLANLDVLASAQGQGEVEISIDNEIGTADNINMFHCLATACFKLVDKDGNTFNNAKVAITCDELKNKMNISLATWTQNSKHVDNTKITATSTSNGLLYIAFPPQDDGCELTFTVNDNDKTYSCTLPQIAGMTAGKYYKAKNENGRWGPIEVKLSNINNHVIADQSLNPLIKWSKSNVNTIYYNSEQVENTVYDAFLTEYENEIFEYQIGRIDDMLYSKPKHPMDIRLGYTLYQFGRNIGYYIDYTALNPLRVDNYYIPADYLSSSDVKNKFQNGPIYLSQSNKPYGQTFIGGNYADWCYSGDSYKTWTSRNDAKIVSTMGHYSIPDVVWSLASESDYRTILPSSDLMTKIRDEVIQPEWFNTVGEHIIATELKNKGKDNAVAYRWSVKTHEWLVGSINNPQKRTQTHLVIESVRVDAETTDEDVTEDSDIFDSENRVMRSFPACGYINNLGYNKLFGLMGAYWCSDTNLGCSSGNSSCFQFGIDEQGYACFGIYQNYRHRGLALRVLK